MHAVVYRFRAELRGRWRGWAVLALVIGAVAGTVLVLAAGSRRTGSAPERFLAASNAYQDGVATYCAPQAPTAPDAFDRPVEGRCHAALARLPAVSEAATVGVEQAFIETLDGRSLQPDPTDACYTGRGGVSLLDTRSSSFGRSLNRRRFVAGHDASPAAADEVVLSYETARRMHLGPGDQLRVRLFGAHGCEDDPKAWGPPIITRIVGLQLSPGEVAPPSGNYVQWLAVTPAFARASGAKPDPYLAVRLRPGATVADFHKQAAGAGYPVISVVESAANANAVEEASRPYVLSLAILGGLTGLAGAIVLGQLLVRQSGIDSADHALLSALGMSSRDRLALSALRGIFIGVVAAAVAAALAMAFSPIMPIGIARSIEPHKGAAFDLVTIGFGTVAIVVFACIVTALATMRLARAPIGKDHPAPAAVTNLAVRARLPLTMVSGVRLALTRGFGSSAVPVRSSFGSLAIAVAAITGAFTFAGSLTHLRTSPRLVGWNWDLVVTLPQIDSPSGHLIGKESRKRVRDAFARDRQIVAYSPGVVFPPFPQARPLKVGPKRLEVPSLYAFDGRSAIAPSIITGRKPARTNEVVLGPDTLSALGLHVGDEVSVFAQDGSWDHPGRETSERLRIVGTAVVPPFADQLGRGAAMTMDGLAKLNSEPLDQAYFIRVAPGTDLDSVVSTFRQAFPEVPPQSMERLDEDVRSDKNQPDPLIKLDAIDSIPRVFALLVILMSVAVLAHVLMATTRARRRDLAILRALGLTRGQTALTIGWEGTTYVLVALAVGSPIGVFLGRVAWRAYASGLGVVPQPVTPWTLCLITAIGALVLAAVLAIPPALQATRVRAAVALRSE